jgi:hypothetical protein
VPKEAENKTHDEEKKYAVETDPEITQVMELVNRGVTRAIEIDTMCPKG